MSRALASALVLAMISARASPASASPASASPADSAPARAPSKVFIAPGALAAELTRALEQELPPATITGDAAGADLIVRAELDDRTLSLEIAGPANVRVLSRRIAVGEGGLTPAIRVAVLLVREAALRSEQLAVAGRGAEPKTSSASSPKADAGLGPEARPGPEAKASPEPKADPGSAPEADRGLEPNAASARAPNAGAALEPKAAPRLARSPDPAVEPGAATPSPALSLRVAPLLSVYVSSLGAAGAFPPQLAPGVSIHARAGRWSGGARVSFAVCCSRETSDVEASGREIEIAAEGRLLVWREEPWSLSVLGGAGASILGGTTRSLKFVDPSTGAPNGTAEPIEGLQLVGLLGGSLAATVSERVDLVVDVGLRLALPYREVVLPERIGTEEPVRFGPIGLFTSAATSFAFF